MKVATQATNPDSAAIGLKAAIAILDHWQCSAEQEWAILGLKKSTFYKYRDNTRSARLTDDQVERISYILNIHATLRIIFDNPKNAYGFMGMANHNPYFNGASPLDLISTGRFATLYEVFTRIKALRGAGL